MQFSRRNLLKTGAATTIAGVTGTSLLANQTSRYVEDGIPAIGGRLAGTIRYNGPDVKPREIRVTKDTDICGEGLRRTNPLRLSEDGHLADTVVQIHGIQKGKPWDQEFKEAKIYQIECGFQPRVQIVWEKAKVYVVNLDPILHNINAYEIYKGTRRSMFSFVQPRLGQEDRIPLKLRRSNLINLDCNAHGWMEGWVYTSPTPYFSVSGSDGTFEITDVPPGEFEVSIWHPVLGERRGNIVVKPNDDMKFDLVLS